MKTKHSFLTILLLVGLLLQTVIPAAAQAGGTPTPPAAGAAVQDTPEVEPDPLVTEAASLSEESTPSPTVAPATAAPVQGSARPVIVVGQYKVKPNPVVPGEEFVLNLELYNQGKASAYNLLVTFATGDFLPLKTGGVLGRNEVEPGEEEDFKQSFQASSALKDRPVATLEVRVSYTDESGAAYSEAFSVVVNIQQPQYSGVYYTPTPTPTATVAARPQLVISGYHTDVPILQPGSQFNLALQVLNVGSEDAKRVTMVVGGATITPGGSDNGTPGPPSVSGSGGEFTNFSPLGVSNVQSLGDLAAGSALDASQPLIVNVSTNPGAYSLKISFVHTAPNGSLIVDDQVISLLVYSLPVVEVSYYRQPDPLFAGQPGMLPLQVVNLGRKTAVLGNMKVSAPNGQLMNNTVLVGSLDPGGYFPLDTTLIPEVPGPMELTVSIDYTDDFNQPQSITRTLSIDVMDAPPMDPGMEPGAAPPMDMPPAELPPETFWQSVLRFVRGLIGLDSSRPVPQPDMSGPGGMPPMEGPVMEPGIKGG